MIFCSKHAAKQDAALLNANSLERSFRPWSINTIGYPSGAIIMASGMRANARYYLTSGIKIAGQINRQGILRDSVGLENSW